MPDSLPDAAARAGADLWYETHIAPNLRAPLGSPGSLPGSAAPASDNPLPARAIGRPSDPADVPYADPFGEPAEPGGPDQPAPGGVTTAAP